MTDHRSTSGDHPDLDHPDLDHLDLDALADTLAGERPDDPHLATCGPCRARLAELAAADTAVLASLGALADPPEPDGLAERLRRALADEARADAVAPDSGRVVALRTQRSPSGSRKRSAQGLRRRSAQGAWQQPLAACLALVLAGGVGWALVQGGSSGTDTSTAAGGTAESSDGGGSEQLAAGVLRTRTGTDWADDAAGRAALPQVLAAQDAGALGGAAPADPSGPPAAAPGDDAASRSDADADADSPGPDSPTSDTTVGAADPLARLRDPVALAACLAAVTAQAGAQPLAVDEGTVRGAPALAVLLPDADPLFVQVHVVGPACSAADPAALLRTRVARP